MKSFGLIGKPLTHSFSAKYFTEKFKILNLEDRFEYKLYPLENIEELLDLLKSETRLMGLNVTIPFKKEVLPHCTWLSPEVIEIGAANTLKITRDYEGIVRGIDAYNTDVSGFKQSLALFTTEAKEGFKAIILGDGGASAGVQYVLNKMNIPFLLVSRNPENDGTIKYSDLSEELIAGHKLLINTTPLGMFPDVSGFPQIPFQAVGNSHYLFDLVYNPEFSVFLQKGSEQGAQIKNGLEMLHLQADLAWELWNS